LDFCVGDCTVSQCGGAEFGGAALVELGEVNAGAVGKGGAGFKQVFGGDFFGSLAEISTMGRTSTAATSASLSCVSCVMRWSATHPLQVWEVCC